MVRFRAIAMCVVGGIAATAAAQGYGSGSGRSLNWARNAQAAIAQAKASKLPLMFYIIGDSRERDERLNDARRLAFKDQRVVYAGRRFIAVKVTRSDSRLRSLFAKLDVPNSANMIAVFATPAGKKIDTFSAVHQADTLAQKMTLVFNAYRTRLFDSEIKPVLQEHKTKAATVKKALTVIEKFNIEEADALVIDVLDRWKSDQGISKQGFAALAAISTKPAVDYLISKAKTGRHGSAAIAALAKCTPPAAELMLPMLTGEQPDELLLAYHAVTRICKIKQTKPDGFWGSKNTHMKSQEIARVKKLVERKATRWKDSYGRYR